jgi:hypothetical protein
MSGSLLRRRTTWASSTIGAFTAPHTTVGTRGMATDIALGVERAGTTVATLVIAAITDAERSAAWTVGGDEVQKVGVATRESADFLRE